MLIGLISDMLIVSYIWRFSITTKKLTITKKKERERENGFDLDTRKPKEYLQRVLLGQPKWKLSHIRKKRKRKEE